MENQVNGNQFRDEEIVIMSHWDKKNEGLRRDEDQKCFAAKARPEWDFRYFSKAAAFSLERKATNVSIRQGRYLEV